MPPETRGWPTCDMCGKTCPPSSDGLCAECCQESGLVSREAIAEARAMWEDAPGKVAAFIRALLYQLDKLTVALERKAGS